MDQLPHDTKNEQLSADQKKQPQARMDTIIEADVDAYIPEYYVEDDSERLDIYRRLYKTQTIEATDDIRLELVDRFGSSVEEVDNRFMVSNLRVLGALVGFRKIELSKRTLRLLFPPDTEKEFYEADAFQSIMVKAGKVQSHTVQLKQEGRQLLLHTVLVQEEDPGRILEAQEILKQFLTQ